MNEAYGTPATEAGDDNQAIDTSFEHSGPTLRFGGNTDPVEGSEIRLPKFIENGGNNLEPDPEGRGFSLPSVEDTEQTSSTFGERAKSFFSSMSERARGVAGKMYEGIYKIPGVQRIAGKMEIACNQYFIDRHEGGAIKLREKAQNLSPQIEAFRLAASETNAAIETLRQMGAPGLAGLEKKALDMDQKTMDLLLEQESLNQKADGKADRMEQFKTRRDQVADRLIGIYAEKMSPIEKRLQSLDNNQHHAETQAAITRAEHEQQLKTLSGIEAKRDTIAQHLTAAGLSEKDIARHEVIKLIDKQIATGREKIKAEDQKLDLSMARIQSGIVTANTRMSEYRIKQKEFENLKRGTLSSEQLGVTTTEETPGEVLAAPENNPVETPSAPKEIKDASEEVSFDLEPVDLDAPLPPVESAPSNAPSPEEAETEATIEETLQKLTPYLEDSPNSLATKEKKAERLKELLESDPDIHEFFQNVFDKTVSDSDQERFVEILNKTQYTFKEGMLGFDIKLPGNDGKKLIVERSQKNVLATRIIRPNV